MGYKHNPRIENVKERRGYTVAEVAGLYRLSCQTVYNEINSGRLKTFTVGRRRIISIDHLKQWEKDNE